MKNITSVGRPNTQHKGKMKIGGCRNQKGAKAFVSCSIQYVLASGSEKRHIQYCQKLNSCVIMITRLDNTVSCLKHVI